MTDKSFISPYSPHCVTFKPEVPFRATHTHTHTGWPPNMLPKLPLYCTAVQNVLYMFWAIIYLQHCLSVTLFWCCLQETNSILYRSPGIHSQALPPPSPCDIKLQKCECPYDFTVDPCLKVKSPFSIRCHFWVHCDVMMWLFIFAVKLYYKIGL